jgi:predicted  nucleic acid-binding Zn-ribbon protein
MPDFKRMKDQRRAEMDETLLRHMQGEETLLKSRIKRLQREVDGAMNVIAEKERQIKEARQQMQVISGQLEMLLFQQSELRVEHDRWRDQMAV